MTNQGRLERVGGSRFLKHETGLFLNSKEPYRLCWVIISRVDEETSLRDSYHRKQADSSMPFHGPGLSLHSALRGPSSSIPEEPTATTCVAQSGKQSPQQGACGVLPSTPNVHTDLFQETAYFISQVVRPWKHMGKAWQYSFVKANVKKNPELYKNGYYICKKNENVPEKMLTVPPLKPWTNTLIRPRSRHYKDTLKKSSH